MQRSSKKVCWLPLLRRFTIEDFPRVGIRLAEKNVAEKLLVNPGGENKEIGVRVFPSSTTASPVSKIVPTFNPGRQITGPNTGTPGGRRGNGRPTGESSPSVAWQSLNVQEEPHWAPTDLVSAKKKSPTKRFATIMQDGLRNIVRRAGSEMCRLSQKSVVESISVLFIVFPN